MVPKMIKIEKIHIQKFRGIIDLEVTFQGQNFTICGPNGTGKSGIVDAIEFVLSGDISRLSGAGRGGVSVKTHAPHVDYRDNPEVAIVSLQGTIVSTSEAFEITRNVANINAPNITPASATIIQTIEQLSVRKNISLSRRELIQYVISTPTSRAAQVNALLQLEQLSNLRKTFQKIANAEESLRTTLVGQRKTAADNLINALNIPNFSADSVLKAVNGRRKILGLPEIEKLDANTSLIDGLATVSPKEAQKSFNKKAVENDAQALRQWIEKVGSKETQELLESSSGAVSKLSKNKMAWKGISRQSLLNEALKHLDETECPVCETTWDLADLIALIQRNLKALDVVVSEKTDILGNLAPVLSGLKSTIGALRTIAPYGEKAEPKHDTETLKKAADTLEGYIKIIEEFKSEESVVSALGGLTICLTALENPTMEFQAWVKGVEEVPDPLQARDFLTLANERLEAWRTKSRELIKCAARAATSKTVFDTYSQTYEDGLNKIYLDVQDEFAAFYKSVNAEDESGFTAILEASKSGLDLNVDFYGKGKFPPSAYHSEGHQDGMGLCLYLALMRHLYADEFQICVLDDVLMSVDSSHRRDVCELIKAEFPNTQFIFTTHDEVWLKNMQSTGIIAPKNFIRFRRWDVNTGPQEWEGRDIWTEIDEKLSNNEISPSAHLLRRYLEYLFGEICGNLEASVIYRGDNQHTLGELLPQGCSRFKKTLKEAKGASTHWKDAERTSEITAQEQKFSDVLATANVEQWAINPAVHYNAWENMQKADFEPVVAALRALCEFFSCPKCSSHLVLSKIGHKKDALKCPCGTISFNLNKG
jgi:ABC-type lipoprotein export system ATPase subunit